MKDHADLLRMKGWKENEIEHALKILKEAEEKKHPKLKMLEKASFWLNLGIVIIASIIFAIVSTGFVYVTEYIGYAFTGIVALIIGTLFTSTFDHLDKLEKYHHIATVMIIATTTLITHVIASSITHVFITDKIQIISRTYNPWFLAITYTVFFLVPYIYHIWHDNYIKKREA